MKEGPQAKVQEAPSLALQKASPRGPGSKKTAAPCSRALRNAACTVGGGSSSYTKPLQKTALDLDRSVVTASRFRSDASVDVYRGPNGHKRTGHKRTPKEPLQSKEGSGKAKSVQFVRLLDYFRSRFTNRKRQAAENPQRQAT